MKNLNFATLFVVVAATVGATYAQNGKKERPKWMEERTTVFIVGVGSTLDTVAKQQARSYFEQHLRTGFQQDQMPRFLITDPAAKAVFAVGGFVTFRTAYDFDRVMPSLDFIPYQTPMVSSPANSQRLLMDASTSRLYFKTVIKTGGGPLEAYISTDFRGGGYALRLREAYISYFGFTLGQTTTTFSDLNASFNTIDFQGPNGYTYGRNLLVRYEHKWSNGFSLALGVEYPVVGGTYCQATEKIYQRVPDIPAYLQYAWKGGHIRASGIIRNMFYHNNITRSNIDAIGWGAQLSGSSNIGSRVRLYGNIVYGQGITPYVSDLQGSNMDLVHNTTQIGQMVSPRTLSWLAGLQINITPKMPLTLGYSQVRVYDTDHVLGADNYRVGQYVVANMFYNISRYWNVGVEYLYGTRTNFDGSFGKSTRVQAAVQFSF